MVAPAIEIRPARPDEAPDAVASVVAAFLADPVARFACPRPHDYLRAAPLAAREVARRSFEHGSAWVSADLRAAALWLPSGVPLDGEALTRLLRVTVEPTHVGDLLGIVEKLEQWRPAEPHWYLPVLAVEPTAQGSGLGAALLRPALDRCDAEGACAHLQATNARNVPFFERLGFVVLGEIRVGAAPPVIPMLRRPRRAAHAARPAASR